MGQAQSLQPPIVQQVPASDSGMGRLAKQLSAAQQAMNAPAAQQSEEHHSRQICPEGCVPRDHMEHFGMTGTNWLLWIVILIILIALIWYGYDKFGKPKE